MSIPLISALKGTLQGVSRRSPGRSRPQELGRYGLTRQPWDSLTPELRKKVVRLHMFLREKYEVGKFVKLKGCIVADGRMQDRSVYTDYSSPTAKTRSVMTCLKLAAVRSWDLLKVDV